MIYSGQIVGAETLPIEWIWRLIENISKPCDHANLVHNPELDPDMQLRVAIDCYDHMPVFALGSQELKALNALVRDEDKRGMCCEPI
jgi:hypothetical protein